MSDLRPAIPVAVEPDTDRVVINTRTLEKMPSYCLTYTQYDLERIRNGYCCLNCGEAQSEGGLPVAFPERCWICEFPMRAEQAQKFAEEFDGPRRVGPSRSLAELRAEDDEVKERERRKREGRNTATIWVPR